MYTGDAIELTAQYAGNTVDSLLNMAVAAESKGDFRERDSAFTAAFRIIPMIDSLLRAHPLYRLERWVNFARSWGNTPQESDYYEEQAKLQITVWGGPNLSEYAAKEWSGLIDDYYLKRWERFADSLMYGKTYDIRNWEMKWIDTPIGYFNTAKPKYPLEFARQLVGECDRIIRR